jgi:hypothetical protein
LPNASTTRTRTDGVMFVPAATVVGCTANTSPLAAAGAMANVFEVAVARPGAVACSRYPEADRSRLRFENVATPATAATVAVPDRVLPPGFVEMAIVMLPVNPVTVAPMASRAVTWTAGVIATPAISLLGCAVNASWVAPPPMANAVEVAPVSPVALAVSV